MTTYYNLGKFHLRNRDTISAYHVPGEVLPDTIKLVYINLLCNTFKIFNMMGRYECADSVNPVFIGRIGGGPYNRTRLIRYI